MQATTQYWRRQMALPEEQAINLLILLGAAQPAELALLKHSREHAEPLTQEQWQLVNLILFAQLAAPTPTLH